MSPDEQNTPKKGRIESLGERLYSRTRYTAPEDEREPITQNDTGQAPQDWQSPKIEDLLMADRRKPEQYPLMKKIFMVSLLFFICAMAAAALIYFKGDNFISTKNLDITVEGPVSIAAGAPVDLEITITNKNNASLSEVNMAVIYPEGTRSALDGTSPLLNTKETLAALGPGEKISKNERAVFLGSEGEVKKVRVSVTYKVEGSNATFTKDKLFELTIGSAPVNVSITRPGSVVSGEPFDAVVTIMANSEEELKDVVLKVEYPYGWSLAKATPEPEGRDKNLWSLGNLKPGEKHTVSLRGVLQGEDNEERTFRFFVGVGEDDGNVETVLSQDKMVISIEKPAIALDIKLNGTNTKDYIAPAGKQITAVITVRNNLTENLQSSQVEVKLSGPALDKLSIAPQGGFYDSQRGSIFWNGSNAEGLGIVAPGEVVSMTVTFASISQIEPGTANQKIDLLATLSGRPQNSNSEVKVSESRTVKIASEVALSTRSLYSRGPFTNSGPIPPKAESETTYTIAVTLGNTQNMIQDAKLVGVLGPNVKWVGQISPEEENVKYDEATRKVTWDLSELDSGAGFSSPAREVFFKVALTPSLGQVGGTPILMNNIVFTGFDVFTDADIRVTNPAVTTRISTDPRYVNGDETVVK